MPHPHLRGCYSYELAKHPHLQQTTALGMNNFDSLSDMEKTTFAVVMAFVEVISSFGLQQQVVQAKRNDENYMYAAAWEFTGDVSAPKLHKEQLEFEYVKPSQRSYK